MIPIIDFKGNHYLAISAGITAHAVFCSANDRYYDVKTVLISVSYLIETTSIRISFLHNLDQQGNDYH